MRRVLKLILHHPAKLWAALLCLCGVYGYARVLMLQLTIGAVQYSIRKYPSNFPPTVFVPLFYSSITVAFFAGIYHDLAVLPSGSWKYVLPIPMSISGRVFRMIGVPLYACVIGIAEAVQVFRNPFMKSDLGRLAAYLQVLQDKSYLDENKLRDIMFDLKWNAWLLKTSDPTTFSYIRLPFDILLAVVVCAIYAISLFCREPRHDGEDLRDATRNHDIAKVKLVLARGTQPNSRGSDGSTALHICAQQAMGNVARILLEHKADPNVRDRLGFTPLHWAVQMRREEMSPANRLEIIRMLVANGADATLGDSKGRTPLSIARKKENASALAVLRDLLGDEIVPEEAEIASSSSSSDSSSSDSRP